MQKCEGWVDDGRRRNTISNSQRKSSKRKKATRFPKSNIFLEVPPASSVMLGTEHS